MNLFNFGKKRKDADLSERYFKMYIENARETAVTLYDEAGKLTQSAEQCHEACLKINEQSQVVAQKFLSAYQMLDDGDTEGVSKAFFEIKDIFDGMRGMAGDIERGLDDIVKSSHYLDKIAGEVHKVTARAGVMSVPMENYAGRKYNIVYMAMLDNEFWQRVRRGALYAKRELHKLGTEVTYVPLIPDEPDWEDVARQTLEDAINNRADAIIFPGFLIRFGDKLSTARAFGIKIIAIAAECAPDVDRDACVAPDYAEYARIAARRAIDRLGGKGKIAILTSDLKIEAFHTQYAVFADYLAENSDIKIAEIVRAKDNATDAYEKAKLLLNSNSDIEMIYSINPFASQVARAIEDTHRVGSTFVIGHELTPKVCEYIKKKIIHCSILEDAFEQGYAPLILAHNGLVSDEPLPGEVIRANLLVVDESNVDNIVV